MPISLKKKVSKVKSRPGTPSLKSVFCPVTNWIQENVGKLLSTKALARKFSDGVFASRLINFFFPKLVELNNYYHVCSIEGKKYNWRYLNTRVLRKLNFTISEAMIANLATSVPEAVALFLNMIKYNVATRLKAKEELKEPEPIKAQEAQVNDDANSSTSGDEKSEEVNELLMQMKQRWEGLEAEENALRKKIKRQMDAVKNVDDEIYQWTRNVLHEERVEEEEKWRMGMMAGRTRPRHFHHSFQRKRDDVLVPMEERFSIAVAKRPYRMGKVGLRRR